MEITTVTVVNAGVTLDYTNRLTHQEKQKLVGEIVKQSSVPDITIDEGGQPIAMREMSASGTTLASIAFTFVCPT